VGDLTIAAPFSVRGEFARQNGPSNADAASVPPAFPLSKCNERRETYRIREEHAFIVARVSGLADSIQELDSILKLSFRQVALSRECVSVPDKGVEQFSKAPIFSSGHCAEHTAGVASSGHSIIPPPVGDTA
jgi:hypothetical protein